MSTQAALTDSVTKKGFSYFLYRLNEAKTKLILSVVLGFACVPLLTIFLNLYLEFELKVFSSPPSDLIRYEENPYYENGLLYFVAFIAILAFALVVFMAFQTAYANFNYHFNRNVVDMNHSLPLKRSERFWADFSSALCVAVPFIIITIIGIVVADKVLIEKYVEVLSYQNRYGGVNVLEAATMLRTTLYSLIPTALFGFFSIYVVFIFGINLSGRLFEAVLYPILILILMPVAVGLSLELIFNEPHMNYSSIGILKIFSPFIFMISSLESATMTLEMLLYNYNAETGSSFSLATMIPSIIIIILFMTGAIYLNKKRSAEKTGSSSVLKYTNHIFISIITFTILLGMCCYYQNSVDVFDFSKHGMIEFFTSLYFIISLMISIFVFFMYDVIIKRKLKKLHITFLRYVATVIASVAVMFVLEAFDSFGRQHFVPESDEIESVSVDIYDNYTWSELISGINNVFTEENDINYIQNLFKENIEAEPSTEKHQKYFYFTMKNGDLIRRKCWIDIDSLTKAQMNLYSEKLTDNALERLKVLSESPKIIKKYVDVTDFAGAFSTEVKADYDELLEIFEKDLRNAKYEDITDYQNGPVGRIHFWVDFSNPRQPLNGGHSGEGHSYLIMGNYKNTIDYLKEHGIVLETRENALKKAVNDEKNGELNLFFALTDSVRLVEEDNIVVTYDETVNIPVGEYENNEEFRKLIDYSYTVAFTSNYKRVVNTSTNLSRYFTQQFYIESEFNELFEKLFIEYKEKYGSVKGRKHYYKTDEKGKEIYLHSVEPEETADVETIKSVPFALG